METFEGQNWGILKTVKVIELSRLGFSEIQNPIDFGNIYFENGYNFEFIPHIFESATFLETDKMTPAGTLWNKKVKLTIPKLRNEVFSFLKSYENRKLALLVTDMNNESHLIYPVRMSRQRNIPGQATSLNATNLEFSGEYHNESPFVINIP